MKYIWSDSLEEMVVKEFTWKGQRYIWDDRDCVYYNEESDEDWLSEIPIPLTSR